MQGQCRKKYPNLHLVPDSELNFPMDRINFDEYKYKVETSTSREVLKDIEQPAIVFHDDWDDLNVQTYDPQKYAATAPIIRTKIGAQPSERKDFRKAELIRLEQIQIFGNNSILETFIRHSDTSQVNKNLPEITVEIFSESALNDLPSPFTGESKTTKAQIPDTPSIYNSLEEDHIDCKNCLTINLEDYTSSSSKFNDESSVVLGKIEVKPKTKQELLEYLTQSDGSVICKMCGEVLASRTHWYRHKYKLHVPNTGQPAPLFQCEQCNAYFKSRKGYIGHLSSRHTEPDLNGISVKQESIENDLQTEKQVEHKIETLLRTSSSTDSYKSNSNCENELVITTNNTTTTTNAIWDEQREREEKLVAEIIDRVRRECEAQGTTVSRKGYSRRTTIINT